MSVKPSNPPTRNDVTDCAYGAENTEELSDCIWHGETVRIIET